MINPVHNLKRFVKYKGDEKPQSFYTTDTHGWLGSGVFDKNGVEIFEGDRVKAPDRTIWIVEFRKGALLIDGEPIAEYGNTLEIIGHVATEDEQ